MIIGRALLASALCLVLILQSLMFVPASAVLVNNNVGDWTGTIEGDFRGMEDAAFGHFKRSAELTFKVAKDGSISGTGTGWEQYSDTSGCIQGRADKITFKISGHYGRAAGPHYGDTGALLSFKTTPNEYPTVDCNGYRDSFKMHPFRAWGNFEIDLKDGASLDSRAGAKSPIDYPPSSGTDVLVIHGGGLNIKCPALTITPTMPPASDPRNLAAPTDSVSYRLQVAWDGEVPAKVNFDVKGVDGHSIQPGFAFNPANMLASPINVIMDVTTDQAIVGEHPFTVIATVNDPSTGEACQAETQVILVVSRDTRANSLPLLPAGNIANVQGDVQIKNFATGETLDAKANLKVGAGDMIITGSDPNTIVDLSSKDGSIQIGRNAKVLFAKVGQTTDADGNKSLKIKPPPAPENSSWVDCTPTASAGGDRCRLIDEGVIDLGLGPLTGLPSILYGGLATREIVMYVIEGIIHNEEVHHKEHELSSEHGTEGRGANQEHVAAIVTPTSIVVPHGTEFTVNVDPDGRTSVDVLDGSVDVVDRLGTYRIENVQAGQWLFRDAEKGESLTSLEIQNIERWWLGPMYIEDYATAKAVNSTAPYNPVNRTTVFSEQDQEIHVWIKFLNVPPPTHRVDFTWYTPDGSLHANNTSTLQDPSPKYSEWSSYIDHGSILASDAVKKPGLWKVDIYVDGDLVKEMSFYAVKSSLVKSQSAKYTFVAEVDSSNEEVRAYLKNTFTSLFVKQFTGVKDDNNNAGTTDTTSDEIEWIKATITDNSPQHIAIQNELKIKGQQSHIFSKEISSLSDISSSSVPPFIPTIGIGKGYTLSTGTDKTSAGSSSQLVLDKTVDLNVGGSNIKAFEFSGNSSGLKAEVHYEKDTGMLVDFLVSGQIKDPQIGTVGLNLGLRGLELTIPTTLSISLPSEIQENKDLVVTGKIIPAVNEGQVILTYQKDSNSEPPIRRTVSVANGNFSETYKLEGYGGYTVSAQYVGSGAYLSSTSDKEILTITEDEGRLLIYGITGIIVFFGIIAAIVVPIYLALKRRKAKKKEKEKENQMHSRPEVAGVG